MKKLLCTLLLVSLSTVGCLAIFPAAEPPPRVITKVCPSFPAPSEEVVTKLTPTLSDQAVKSWFDDLFILQRQLKQCQPD